MNPFIIVIFILLSFGCSHRTVDLAPSDIAADSLADNKVRVLARRTIEQREICFEITLQMKGVELKDIAPSNWTLAWVDQNSRYYLMNLTQRNPASTPEKTGDLYTSHFRLCSPEGKFGKLHYLLLSPKSLPFPEVRGMKLEWR